MTCFYLLWPQQPSAARGTGALRLEGQNLSKPFACLCLQRQCLSAAVSQAIHYETWAVSSAKMRALHSLSCRYEGKSTNLSNTDVIYYVPCSSYEERGKALYFMAHGIAVPTDVFFHVLLTGHTAQTGLGNRILQTLL